MTHRIGIVLSDELEDYIATSAMLNGRTISGQVRWIIAEYARLHDPDVKLGAPVRAGRKARQHREGPDGPSHPSHNEQSNAPQPSGEGQ
jgi:hypothetical protein